MSDKNRAVCTTCVCVVVVYLRGLACERARERFAIEREEKRESPVCRLCPTSVSFSSNLAVLVLLSLVQVSHVGVGEE